MPPAKSWPDTGGARKIRPDIRMALMSGLLFIMAYQERFAIRFPAADGASE
jgi:hypothetical protein